MLRNIFKLVLLTGVCLLVACSSAKKREPAALVPVEDKAAISAVWSISVGKSETFTMRPALAGDYIFTSSGNGTITKIDVLTGKVMWEVKAPVELSSGPGSDGSVVVVGTAKGSVYAYDANGQKIWEEKVGGEVLTEPLVLSGVAVIRTIDNRFLGLEAKTGKRLWSYVRPQSALALRTSFAMMPIASDALITGFSGGKIGILGINSGNLLWEASLAFPKGFSEIERMTEVAAKPTLVGKRLCAVAFQGRIACGEVGAPNFVWSKEFSSFTGTAQNQDFVYAADEKSHVVAYRAADGVEVWRNETMTWRDVGEPLVVGAWVVMGDSQGYLHVLDQAGGKEVSRVRVDSSAIGAAPIVASGLLIVQTRGGTLAAYRPN